MERINATEIMHYMRLCFCLTFCFFTLNLTIVNSQNDKLSLDVEALSENTEVIVKFSPFQGFEQSELPYSKEEKGRYVYQTLQQHANVTQASAIDYLEKEDVRFKSYCVANVILVTLSPQQIEQISSDHNVTRISLNDKVVIDAPRVEQAPDQRSVDVEWGIVKIGADSVWAMGYTGEGVVIGGQDTGYEWDHPALSKAYRGNDGDTVDHNYNWHDAIHELNPLNNDTITNPDNTPCGINGVVPCDDHGHGTHTMGTMIGLDGENMIGVAPGSKWIGVRCMERGWGSPMSYIEGFEWFLAPTDVNGENPDPSKAPHVINNSWRCPDFEGCNPENFELIRQAIINLKAAGIVVVVSAGNEGSNGCSSIDAPPSMFAESFVVGSTRSNDTISGFSSRGPVTIDSSGSMKPDVTAPGSLIRSAELNGSYDFKSGTSMSGPHVAGAVALIISANPELAGQVDVIEEILKSTAVPLFTDQDCTVSGSESPNNTYGYGRIDVLAAVEKALTVTAVNAPIKNKDAVIVYPNPTHGVVHIDTHSDQLALINVYTMQGRLVKAFTQYQSGGELDLSILPPGAYMLSIAHNESQVGGVQTQILILLTP